jgi:prepilin-type N-terminal cleavage/methylation domain-containing protein
VEKVPMNTQKQTKGFTIIEVVLVLAIAGLIFLMVFTALPALQKSQRDSARKNDVGIVASAVTSYTGNNRGTFPTSGNLDSYVSSKSSNTTSVTVGQAAATSVNPDDGIIVVTQQSSCGDSSTTSQALNKGTTRQFTVVTKLESGSGSYFCQDS